MGKFLVGCLVALVLVVGGGATVGYFMFLKPGIDFAADVVRFGEEFQQLDRSIEDRSPYVPPRDGQVSSQQFERYLAAQRQIRAQMENRLQELQEKYESLQAELDAQDAEPSMRQMAEAYRDLGHLLMEAKRAQVSAINAHDFSLAEYHWVRNQVYQAIGESVAVAAIGEQAGAARQTRVPAETVAMVEPHRDELMEMHVLAWWGL